MKDFLNEIKLKIIDEINPEGISLIDNSYLHSKHKSFDAQRYHIKIIIKLKKLKKMNTIRAHKLIFSTLENEMKNKIHALEIKIE